MPAHPAGSPKPETGGAEPPTPPRAGASSQAGGAKEAGGSKPGAGPQAFVVRPVFLLVVGWFMAVAQVLRRHTANMERYHAFLLLPAYQLFYTAFAGAALFALFRAAAQVGADAGRLSCDAFRSELLSRFGFMATPTAVHALLMRLAVVLAVGVVTGAVFAFLARNGALGAPPETVHDYRRLFVRYAVFNLFAGLFGFIVLAPALLPAEGAGAPGAGLADCK